MNTNPHMMNFNDEDFIKLCNNSHSQHLYNLLTIAQQKLILQAPDKFRPQHLRNQYNQNPNEQNSVLTMLLSSIDIYIYVKNHIIRTALILAYHRRDINSIQDLSKLIEEVKLYTEQTTTTHFTNAITDNKKQLADRCNIITIQHVLDIMLLALKTQTGVEYAVEKDVYKINNIYLNASLPSRNRKKINQGLEYFRQFYSILASIDTTRFKYLPECPPRLIKSCILRKLNDFVREQYLIKLQDQYTPLSDINFLLTNHGSPQKGGLIIWLYCYQQLSINILNEQSDEIKHSLQIVVSALIKWLNCNYYKRFDYTNQQITIEYSSNIEDRMLDLPIDLTNGSHSQISNRNEIQPDTHILDLRVDSVKQREMQ